MARLPGHVVDKRSMVALLSLLLLSGCADPRGEVDAYSAALAPSLQKNATLGKAFRDAAAQIKKGESDGKAVADQFTTKAVPLADEVARSVASVQPKDPKLSAAHTLLVKAWADRAQAYGEAGKAWQAGDRTAFDAARRREVEVHDQEQAYLEAVNPLTEPYGVTIDLYP